MNEAQSQSPGPTASVSIYQTTWLLVAALLAVDGLHFVFARALRDLLPPAVSVVYVIGIGTLELTAFAIARGRLRWSTFRRHAWFFLAVGALVAASTTINYNAVSFVAPGTASLLSETSILFGLGFGFFWLGDRLRRMQVFGALIAIFGVAVISYQPGDYLRVGSLLVIGSSFLYACHTAAVKRYGGDIDFVEFFVWRLIVTVGFLLASASAQRLWVWPDGRTWLVLVVAGTTDVVISRTLYYTVLRRLDISIHTLILTASPVVAILWSLFLFGIRPDAQDLLGGLAVLAGVAIVTRGGSVKRDA
ncbi:MAG: DMT family transporter [Chloroflexi bacterium]|nr:DMT family transporter [Chloroflexota bacterium]